jgi:OmpA-OmpF porin, OOP family
MEASKRFSELSEYDTKDQLDIRFASGSTVISAADQEALKKLAHNAVNLTGYILQVKGFADSSGNASMNQKLSMERAQNVIAYLLQNCNVPVRHVIAPGAMAEAAPVASNETSTGHAENHRVEVKVLINKRSPEARTHSMSSTRPSTRSRKAAWQSNRQKPKIFVMDVL